MSPVRFACPPFTPTLVGTLAAEATVGVRVSVLWLPHSFLSHAACENSSQCLLKMRTTTGTTTTARKFPRSNCVKEIS